MDKKLYKVFIGMVAIGVGIQLYNAYHDHKERKENAKEREANKKERELRMANLKQELNGKQEQ